MGEVEDVVGWMFTSMDKQLAVTPPASGPPLDDGVLDVLVDHLRRAGRGLVSEGAPSDVASRADSLHYLLVLLNVAVERGVAQQDPYRPQFSRPWPCHVL